VKRCFVPALDQYYTWDGDVLRFDDGVVYTTAEAILLAEGKPDDIDLKAVHLCKALLGGELTPCDRDAKLAPYLPDLDVEMRKAPPVPLVSAMARKPGKDAKFCVTTGRDAKFCVSTGKPGGVQMSVIDVLMPEGPGPRGRNPYRTARKGSRHPAVRR
jgi:hypothetical protein